MEAIVADLSQMKLGPSPGGGRLIRNARLRTDGGPTELRALIDSGSDLNLIQQRIVVERDLPKCDAKVPRARTVAGQQMRLYGAHLPTIELTDDDDVTRSGQMLFHGADFGPYDVVLGMPWLEAMDPLISFRAKELRWVRDPIARIECLSAVEFANSLGDGDCLFGLFPNAQGRYTDGGAMNLRQVSAVDATTVPEVPTQYRDFLDVLSEEKANELADRKSVV